MILIFAEWRDKITFATDMEDDNSSVDSELENHILTWLEDAGYMNPQVSTFAKFTFFAKCSLTMCACVRLYPSEMISQISSLCALEDAQVDFMHIWWNPYISNFLLI